MESWNQARQQLKTIQELQEYDWLGFEWLKVPLELIESAKRLLDFLEKTTSKIPTDIYPMPDGTILVEWQFDSGKITRIEVNAIDSGEIMVSFPYHKSKSLFSNFKWN